MGKSYNQDAIEKARELYCRFGGKNWDAIEREMRKQYPSWRQTNLSYRQDKSGREWTGWVDEYGFDNSLKLYLQKLTENVNNDEQDLYIGIRTVRKAMQDQVVGKKATKDDIYQYRDFCKLEIEARRNLDLTRDNFETFVSGYEKLINWLGEIEPATAKMLIKHGDRLAALAQAHYGKSEEIDERAGVGEDEGRE